MHLTFKFEHFNDDKFVRNFYNLLVVPLAAPVSKRLDILRLRCEIGEGKIQERINKMLAYV